jgi:hypothetical protein
MALVFANNSSLANITALPSGISGGALNLISTQTASASASLEFSIDSTYDYYVFKFINCHPATEGTRLMFNASTDGGSNYNVTKTTTAFRAYHYESGSGSELSYLTAYDLSQSTSDQYLNQNLGNQNDSSCCGEMILFNPSSTTFVKHFVNQTSSMSQESSVAQINFFSAGYLNTTSAVNSIIFKMQTGNIDDGIIKMYGVS